MDGAIHRAGGPQILQECKEIRARQGGCPTGAAVITGGGRLKASYVIHTVGPVWSGGDNREDELLRSAYWNSLALARERGIRTVSFPSISTGVYHFPVERAARIAVQTVLDFTREHEFEEIRFVLFDGRTHRSFEEAMEELAPV
ncbi:MAG: O-acetyl-ADP-ribose deacetylase [Firmicutes bacterium ADurb.Bin456]|nr:MAG: O-acetyl-ADP-ribose deacetylase [Firmicutes bacterium ADurb.Bin456]